MYFFNRKTINNFVGGLFNWSPLPEIEVIKPEIEVIKKKYNIQECIFCQTENLIMKDSKTCQCKKCNVYFLI